MADKKISQLTGATTPLAGTEVLPIVQGGSTVKVSVDNLTAGKSVSASSFTATGNSSAAKFVPTGGTATGNGMYLPAANTLGWSLNGVKRMELGPDGNALYLNFSGAGLADAVQLYTNYASTTADFYIGVKNSGTLATRLKVAGAGDITYTGGNLVVGTAAKGIDFSANTHAAGMTSELLDWYETGTWTPTLTCTDGNFNSVTYDPLRGGRYTRVGNMVHIQCYMRTDAVDNSVGRSGDVLIAGLPFAAVTATSGTIDGHSSFAVSVASAWAGEEPLGASVSGGDTNIQLFYRSAVDGSTSNIVAADVGTGANANIVLIAGTYICA